MSTLPPAFAASVTVDEHGWEIVMLPDGVSAANRTMTWTRDELVFWGGEDESSAGVAVGDPGLAYNPDTRMWRPLPPSPREVTYGAAAVWNGSELIICCGAHSIETVSYEPVSNSWRELADSPVRGEYAEAVWDWDEETMLVVGATGVARYEPIRDTWSELSDPPTPIGRLNEIAWTGTELIVWPADVGRRVYAGLALDPAEDSWRVLDAPPAWPAMLDIESTGEELIIWGGLPASAGGSERAIGSKLEYDSDIWLELPEALPEPDSCECNLGGQELLWTGSELLVWTGWFGTGLDLTSSLLISYHPNTGLWTLVDATPIQLGSRALMADDRVVVVSDRMAISPPGWQSRGAPLDPSH
jgi:hypothetical protein